MMTNRELVKLLLDQPLDAPVLIWNGNGIVEVTAPTDLESLPDWQQQEANLPAGSIILPG